MLSRPSTARRLGQKLGLIYAEHGQPSEAAPRKSRYDRGLFVSPRLDEDVDALLQRVAELERRLDNPER
jgi:hypothetical protein